MSTITGCSFLPRACGRPARYKRVVAPTPDGSPDPNSSETDAVLLANQQFYDAHEQRDSAAMDAIWEHSDRVVCVHPGWPILRGVEAVLDSWHRILDGPGRNQFILTNVGISIDDHIAWVTLDENLVAGGATGTVAATNAFARQRDGSWLMFLHHGSPVMG